MNSHLPPYASLIRNAFPNLSREDLAKKLFAIWNDVQSVLDKFGMSSERYNFSANDNPFFLPPRTEGMASSQLLINVDMDRFRELRTQLPSEIVISPWLMTLYFMGSNPSRAFSLGRYTIFSFEQFVERTNRRLAEHPTITWTDVGLAGGPMGSCTVLRMDLSTGKFFLQSDGGSNGYERQSNWEIYRNQKIAEENQLTFLEIVQKVGA